MYCENCGNKVDDDAVFCTKCGKQFSQKNKRDTNNIKINLDYSRHSRKSG